MCFVIIRGPAGIGKSTVAKKLAKRLNAYYISFDSVMRKHKLDRIEETCISEANFLRADKIVVPEAARKLEDGKIVVFDGNFYHRSQIIHLKKNLPYRCYIFTLKSNLKDCVEKDSNRKHKIGEKNVRAVYRLVSGFDYGIKISIKNKSDDEIVGKILSHIT